VPVTVKALGGNDRYEAPFLLDTGAIDSMAPATALRRIGITPVGSKAYELADGSRRRFCRSLYPDPPEASSHTPLSAGN
jgi:hypothetical protein